MNLEGRYRRLLLAYPPEYRRERGDELLDTLMELTPAGRKRPSRRQAVSLLRHGMRARLGRPASRGVVVLAVLASLILGIVGAEFGAWLGWQGAPALPNDVQATAFAKVALPDATPVAQSRHDPLFSFSDPDAVRTWFAGAEDYAPGAVRRYFAAQQPDRAIATDPQWAGSSEAAVVAGARERLQQTGWQVGDVVIGRGLHHVGTSASLQARAVFWVMQVTVDNAVSPAVEVEFYRAQPVNVLPLAVFGGLLGALVGWLLLGWASRRLSGVRTGFALLGYVVALMCVAPAIGWSVLDFIAAAILRPTWVPVPWWAGFTMPVARPLSIVAALVAIVALGLSAPASRGKAPTTAAATDRPPAAG